MKIFVPAMLALCLMGQAFAADPPANPPQPVVAPTGASGFLSGGAIVGVTVAAVAVVAVVASKSGNSAPKTGGTTK
jgi:hypothetical protein